MTSRHRLPPVLATNRTLTAKLKHPFVNHWPNIEPMPMPIAWRRLCVKAMVVFLPLALYIGYNIWQR